MTQWKITVGNDYTLLQNREWSQKQKHEKQPWSNAECPRKRAFHVAPMIKTARRFTAKKPLMIT